MTAQPSENNEPLPLRASNGRDERWADDWAPRAILPHFEAPPGARRRHVPEDSRADTSTRTGRVIIAGSIGENETAESNMRHQSVARGRGHGRLELLPSDLQHSQVLPMR